MGPRASLAFDFGFDPPTQATRDNFARKNDEMGTNSVPFPQDFWSLRVRAFLSVPQSEDYVFL
eukprot:1336134-Prorocentrum_lima.AAC.1